MLLEGKRGFVLGVLNDRSIAWAIAKLALEEGAEVVIGVQDERRKETVSRLIAPGVPASVVVCDVTDDESVKSAVQRVTEKLGKVDFFVHSVASAKTEELGSRFIQTSREGFQYAMDVSCYSLVSVCAALEPHFSDKSSVLAMSYLGSVRAVGNYNVMGVAKAALESAVRYLAADLGPQGVRVNAVSPGPINTVSARGVKGLSEMIDFVAQKAPLRRAANQEDVARTSLYLMSDLASGVTGQVIYVDSGYHIMGM
jgi:enoyl-[acyl-carrier protein] reductase I